MEIRKQEGIARPVRNVDADSLGENNKVIQDSTQPWYKENKTIKSYKSINYMF